MPRCPAAGRISQRMGLYPASTPLAHGPIRDANGRGDLFVVLFRMFMNPQNDPGTHRHRLRRGMCTDEMLKRFGFFIRQCDWMSGLGTTHWFHLPLPVYLLCAPPVKRGTDL